MRRTHAIISAVLLAALAVLLPAAPAAARPTTLAAFDLQTIGGPPPSDGSARATGTVTFLSKSKLRVTGSINDRCPADGYGAYLYMTGVWSNGDVIWAPPRQVAADLRTCDASSTGLPFDEPFQPNATRTIKWIQLNVYEYNANNGAYGQVSDPQQFWNPYR